MWSRIVEVIRDVSRAWEDCAEHIVRNRCKAHFVTFGNLHAPCIRNFEANALLGDEIGASSNWSLYKPQTIKYASPVVSSLRKTFKTQKLDLASARSLIRSFVFIAVILELIVILRYSLLVLKFRYFS